MRAADKRKKLLAGASLVICTFVVVVGVVLAQLHRQESAVAEQRGISREAATALRSLAASDSLFNLPELGTANTVESRLDATFMVSAMARNSDYVMATEKTKDSLYSYAKNEQNFLSFRLKAYAALRNFRDERWKEWKHLAEKVNEKLPSSVSEDDVSDYLAIAEPLALLDDSFTPRTHYVPFNSSANEHSERLAVSMIILDYLFSNGAEVRENFKELQPKLCRWASGDATYLQQTLFAANALIGTDKSTCINSDYIKSLYGCRGSSQLLSIDGKASSECSLSFTYYAYRLGITK